jgi:3-deoxy-7-phosphoheptulonate synthase
MVPPMEGIRLAAWDPLNPNKTVLPVGSAKIGGTFTVLARLVGQGDEALVVAAARTVKEAGAQVFGWTELETGADDRRMSGAPAGRFALLREIADLTGLPVLVEVTDTKEVAKATEAADMLLVGAANMQNFSLLKEVGRTARKPVALVRDWHATLMEWLNSAEYVLFEGNPQVVLCEAGIRSFEGGSRVILDLSSVPAAKKISHLPVFVDLSRAGGFEEIGKMGLAAVAAGADGLIVEVALPPEPFGPSGKIPGIGLAEFAGLVSKMKAMRTLMGEIGIDRS